MKTAFFDISSDSVKTAVEQIKDEHNDSLMVMAPFSGKMSMHAPSKSGKHKGYHRIKCEIWIPEDAIQGEDALTDFGAFAVMRLPKARVQDHLKS
jgi:hypothetical protein